MADPNLQIRARVGGHPDPKKDGGGGGWSQKKYFWPQFGIKIGGPGPSVSPLEPPLGIKAQ